jgi:hypothetical protein
VGEWKGWAGAERYPIGAGGTRRGRNPAHDPTALRERLGDRSGEVGLELYIIHPALGFVAQGVKTLPTKCIEVIAVSGGFLSLTQLLTLISFISTDPVR